MRARGHNILHHHPDLSKPEHPATVWLMPSKEWEFRRTIFSWNFPRQQQQQQMSWNWKRDLAVGCEHKSHLCQREASLNRKKSNTEIRVIIFQLKWGCVVSSLTANEKSGRKMEKATEDDLLYYLPARVQFCIMGLKYLPHIGKNGASRKVSIRQCKRTEWCNKFVLAMPEISSSDTLSKSSYF